MLNANKVTIKLQDVLSQIIHCLGLHNKRKLFNLLIFKYVYVIFQRTFLNKKSKNKKNVKK